ncbi:LysR substrate-binding domain-containing protein [Yersinia enterocolitica]
MFDWESMRHFLAVGREKTLSGAARVLGVDHATVSRRLASLEGELQLALVERLPRACHLTDAGRHLFEIAEAMETGAFAVERAAQAVIPSLTGRVTLSAPPVLVTHLLAMHLSDFSTRYPGITLSVASQPQQVSLVRREADIALRLMRPTEASSIVRRIGRMEFGIYASKRYSKLDIPSAWEFITYTSEFAETPQQKWLSEIMDGRRASCEFSDINSQLVAALANAGLAALPIFIGNRHRSLFRLQADSWNFSRDVWVIFHKDLKTSVSIRAVIDFLVEALARNGLSA